MMKRASLWCLTMLLILSSFPVFSVAETEAPDPAESGPSWTEQIPDMVDETDIVEGSVIAAIRTADGTGHALPELGKTIQMEVLMELSGTSGKEMEDVVLAEVRSDSLSTEKLLRKLADRQDVVFAEPDYRVSVPSEEESAEASGLTEAAQLAGAPASTEVSALAETPALTGASAADDTDPADAVLTEEETPYDFSGLQYAFNGEYGIGVPGWNTYDSSDRPTPAQDASGQIVAVMDTGVDYNHEDLKESMWSDGENYPELAALGGGKYGYNACKIRKDGSAYNSADPMDEISHGTHCAGIIAAQWNQKGVSGAASGAKIMAVKVMNDFGWGETSEFIAGFQYVITAVKAGVPVSAVNCSWGEELRGRAFDLAIREAGALGAVTVFAAGNEYMDIDTMNAFNDALLHNPYAIIVGNSTSEGSINESSCYGKKTVDLFAPGDNVFSTVMTGCGNADPDALPVRLDGTSYDCGFETQKVDANREDGVFGFAGDEMAETRISIAEKGFSGGHSLRLKPGGGCVVNSRTLTASEQMKGLTMKMKSPGCDSVGFMVVFYDDTGVFLDDYQGSLKGSGTEWKTLSARLPSLSAGDHFWMSISIYDRLGEETIGEILIDDVRIVGKTLSYDYMSGTSMAAPAVTGSAAVLAAAFPQDDAAKRAARIKGSVKTVEDLQDLCTSGGVFRLDQALGEKTSPVPVSLSNEKDTFTVKGFFFGKETGKIELDGHSCRVLSWSETEVTAQLPEDLSGGDVPVVLTSSDGKEGLEYLPYGNAPFLMKRLPLPGRSVSGDPGVYEITSDEYDDTFYSSQPVALIGAADCLFYFMNKYDQAGYIFCYDLEKQSWSKIYKSRELIPTGGACTWNGKLLFIAGSISPGHASASLCSYDLRTKELTASEYNHEAMEYCCALLNTGSEIILAGGSGHAYAEPRFNPVEKIRTVDPETLTVSILETDEQSYMYKDNYTVAWNENGTGYGLNSDSSYFSLFTFDKKDGRLSVSVNYSELFKEEDISYFQDYGLTGGPVRSGFMVHGPVRIGHNRQVTADTYVIAPDGSGYTSLDRCASLSVIYNARAAVYKGHFYTIGVTNSENGGWVFCETEANTIPQPGELDPDC